MSKNFLKVNPFRPMSASSAIFEVLARARKPLSADEVRRMSKVPEGKTKTLLAAYVNPMHLAPLKRVGIALHKDEKGYSLVSVPANPKARRPERGVKKAKRKSPKSPAAKKSAPPKSAAPDSKPVVTPAAMPDLAAENK